MIEVKNLTKKFGDLLVLDDISEIIHEGAKIYFTRAPSAPSIKTICAKAEMT